MIFKINSVNDVKCSVSATSGITIAKHLLLSSKVWDVIWVTKWCEIFSEKYNFLCNIRSFEWLRWLQLKHRFTGIFCSYGKTLSDGIIFWVRNSYLPCFSFETLFEVRNVCLLFLLCPGRPSCHYSHEQKEMSSSISCRQSHRFQLLIGKGERRRGKHWKIPLRGQQCTQQT